MGLDWSYLYANAAVLSEGIAAFCVIVFRKNLPDKGLLIFPLILTLIFTVELGSGIFISEHWKPVVYNLLSIITFSGYSYIFFKHISDEKYKSIVKVLSILYLLSVLTNTWHVSIFDKSHQFSYIVGGINMILFPVMYFLSILNNSKFLNFKQDLVFWISTGLLLFYVGYMPIKLSRYFFSIHANPFFILMQVQILLVIIMNFCFILGSIWMKKK